MFTVLSLMAIRMVMNILWWMSKNEYKVGRGRDRTYCGRDQRTKTKLVEVETGHIVVEVEERRQSWSRSKQDIL